ncbi:hypothetical protein P152DRAFT_455775 [Eremomyces bilateralis CBS 781.70]|uniref:Uncharacterized protein n=1 Tax=Eremomyces bilateralis CBS 781.70 TaxID=1392243 RepID=A0A6G1G9H9_9PEZI|nr:uncharacterized protein P152DRAFT_455775 [Eremomyces bilateralis CBS 781.70]KAF1814737.1 hypothetical protein P152DRAFT_455775 [Eremomyces bilateralis CBS 781.70]
MRDASHLALQGSSTLTVAILSDLLDKDALQYLPVSVIVCVFVPMTINYIFLRCSLRLSGTPIHKLAVYLRALEVLAERDAVVPFYHSLLNDSIVLIHKRSFTPESSLPTTLSDALLITEQAEEVTMPPTNIYSAVLKFQEQQFWKKAPSDVGPAIFAITSSSSGPICV